MDADATVWAQFVALATAAAEQASTQDYEQWAKEPHWAALGTGLPLVLGIRPVSWPRLLASVPAASCLQDALARVLELPSGQDAPVAPARLRAAAEQLGLVLPQPLAQLLDFLGRVLPREEEADSQTETQVLAAQERETLLGIALLLVTRTPRECLDEHGYFDVDRITDLLLQRAARWFPLTPPTLDRDGIRRLLAAWVTPGV